MYSTALPLLFPEMLDEQSAFLRADGSLLSLYEAPATRWKPSDNGVATTSCSYVASLGHATFIPPQDRFIVASCLA